MYAAVHTSGARRNALAPGPLDPGGSHEHNPAGWIAAHVVLVHGGFVDGSGWQGVYHLLKDAGYSVRIVQNPTISLEGDVAATKMIIGQQSEPVILVGHSYGGRGVPPAGGKGER